MRVVITGGGTGGHIIPALAVAKALQGDPDLAALLYIGHQNGMEKELAEAAGVEFRGIEFYGMPRLPGPRLIQWGMDLLKTTDACKKILREVKPTIVFGTGGYVSAPVLLAAHHLNINYVIHEPDASPGLANRFLSWGALHITAAFAESRSHFRISKNSHKFTVTGNPIHAEFGQYTQAQAVGELGLIPGKTTLLVFGGSQGAQRINMATLEALPVLINEMDLQVVHITGAKRFDETMAALPETCKDNPAYKILPFSSQMPQMLAACDLAVCRAGSLTLSELYATGTPSILVPYPYAAANHQYKNAMAAQGAGAATVLADILCTGKTLVGHVRQLLENPDRLAQMRESARKLAKPDATAQIVAKLRR